MRVSWFHSLWLPLLLLRLAVASPATVTVTVATANLTDNTTQAYHPPGIRILQAMRPDILAIQEFNYQVGAPADLAELLLGPDAHYIREKGGGALPNGIVSRYPILDHGQWPDPYIGNRSLVWATIAIPGPKPLHVISVHLVQRRAALRIPQATHLLRLIRNHFAPDDYVVLCGDFNTATRDAAALAILTDWFDDTAQPTDQNGNPNTNSPRTRPYDYVLPSPALAPHHAPTVLAGQTFPDGLVFDTSLWNPPPPPAEWDDTAANMQHLPVMKTFHIPLN
ncbi:MAG: hypothetical protein GX803_03875 [Lentisphaerae bacterium]|nr:hypothetical protein [Lentisphaerota bacterium]